MVRTSRLASRLTPILKNRITILSTITKASAPVPTLKVQPKKTQAAASFNFLKKQISIFSLESSIIPSRNSCIASSRVTISNMCHLHRHFTSSDSRRMVSSKKRLAGFAHLFQTSSPKGLPQAACQGLALRVRAASRRRRRRLT